MKINYNILNKLNNKEGDIIKSLSKAIKLSRNLHRLQTRKDGETPFINHPLELLEILLEEGILDENILSASLLHDVIEDTDYTKKEMLDSMGKDILNIILDCTDDKTQTKYDRKKHQIEHSLEISESAVLVKLVDKISNLNSMLEIPPVGWSINRILGYTIWSKRVVNSLSNNNNKSKYKNEINNFTNMHTFLVLEIFENYKIDLELSEDIFENYMEDMKLKN